jgi:xanthine dehydrogenase accessory factor
MMPAALSRRAAELAERGEPYVCATVVRAQRPTSAKAGDSALVLADGTIEGFVGGDCAEHSVREYALRAIESGDPVLLRIVPFAEDAAEHEHGAVTVQNPCLSGGTIEVFLEPVLRAPRVLVEGDTPISRALLRMGAELGLQMEGVDGEFEPRPADLALVAAGHGREELPALRCALEAELPYVGLVASRRRGGAVLAGLALTEEQRARVHTPAGLDLGARTAPEIALSIYAEIVASRPRAPAVPPPPRAPAESAEAVDPVCGMTVSAADSALHLQHAGRTWFFCGSGCQRAFADDPDRYAEH